MTKQPNHRFLAALAVVLALALVAGVTGPAAAQEKGKTRSPTSSSSWETISAGPMSVPTIRA